jgi:hypothetical protein
MPTKVDFSTVAISIVLLFSLFGLVLGIGNIWYPLALMPLWVALTASLCLLVSRSRRLTLSAGFAILGIPIALFQVAEFAHHLCQGNDCFPWFPSDIYNIAPLWLVREHMGWWQLQIVLYAVPFYYAPLFGAALLIGAIVQLPRKKNLWFASLGSMLLLGSHLLYAVTYDRTGSTLAILMTVPLAIVAFPLAILAIRKAPAPRAQGPRTQPAAPRLSDIERQLMEMIQRGGGRISAGTAAEEFGVTPEQVRRTLQDLARRGLIRL